MGMRPWVLLFHLIVYTGWVECLCGNERRCLLQPPTHNTNDRYQNADQRQWPQRIALYQLNQLPTRRRINTRTLTSVNGHKQWRFANVLTSPSTPKVPKNIMRVETSIVFVFSGKKAPSLILSLIQNGERTVIPSQTAKLLHRNI